MGEQSHLYLSITRGCVTVVDIADADLVELKWQVLSNRRNQYAIRRNRKGTTYLHRVILSRMLGRDLVKGEHVDHINGNGLDNRRENLRLATNAQNHQNQRLNQNNTSGYKGVYFRKDARKWIAQITINGKMKNLGCFNTPEAAHKAYCEAAREIYGEFARFE